MNDTQQYAVVNCAKCYMPFAVTAEFEKKRKEDHSNFYCPVGHLQHWPQQSETERLRKLADERGNRVAVLQREIGDLNLELGRCERRCKRKKK